MERLDAERTPSPRDQSGRPAAAPNLGAHFGAEAMNTTTGVAMVHRSDVVEADAAGTVSRSELPSLRVGFRITHVDGESYTRERFEEAMFKRNTVHVFFARCSPPPAAVAPGPSRQLRQPVHQREAQQVSL